MLSYGIADNSLVSLSSLCAPEHFGLGRYGDPVDPEACFKAFKSMQRVLAKGGHLYISVPIGEHDGVAFNAHRIFRPETITESLEGLRLVEFSVIHDDELLRQVDIKGIHELGLGTNYNGTNGGLFEFVKDQAALQSREVM